MRFQRPRPEVLRGCRVSQELVPSGPEAMSIFEREMGGRRGRGGSGRLGGGEGGFMLV